MKKQFLIKTKAYFSSIIFSTLILFASCDFATNVAGKFKEYTEQVTIVGTNISELQQQKKYPVKDGAYIIPSNEDFIITFTLANPQNFELTTSKEMVNNITAWFGEGAKDNITLLKQGEDKSKIQLQYSTNYLEKYDQNKQDITPTIGLWYQDETKEIEKYKPDIKIRCNTPPLSIKDHEIYNLELEDGVDGSDKYVIVFDMPVSPSEIEGSIHNDIKLLKLKEEVHNGSAPTKNRSFSFNWPTSKDFDFSGTDQKYEIKKMNDGYKARLQSYSYNDTDRTFYIETDYSQNDGDITYTFVLNDGQLDSVPEEVFTKAWPKLIMGLGRLPADNKIPQNLADKSNPYIAKVKLTLPTVNFHYEKLNPKTGSFEVYSKYLDSVTKKPFTIEFNEDGESYLEFGNYNGSDKAEITARFDEFKNKELKKITLAGNDLNGRKIVVTEIRDANNNLYSTDVSTPTEGFNIPAGTFTVVAHQEKNEFRNSSPQNFTLTVLAKQLYVSAASTQQTEYGSRNYPYKTVTKAAAALTDKTDSGNIIDVNGEVTENISLPVSDSVNKINLVGLYNDQLKNYSKITAKDTVKPALTVPSNYESKVSDFIFTGSVSIGDNSKITISGEKSDFMGKESFEEADYSSAITDKLKAGSNNNLTITNTVLGDKAEFGEKSNLTIGNIKSSAGISVQDKSEVTMKNSVFTAVEFGNNIKFEISDTKMNSLTLGDNAAENSNVSSCEIEGNVSIGNHCKGITIENTTISGNLVVDDYTIVTLKNVTIVGTATLGEGSHLVLSGTTSIGDYEPTPDVILTTAKPNSDGTINESTISYLKLAKDYSFVKKIILTMKPGEHPLLNTPVIDYTELSDSDKNKVTTDIESTNESEAAYEYFEFYSGSYYIDAEKDANEKYTYKAIVQLSAVGVEKPVIGGFQLTLKANNAKLSPTGKVFTATSGSTLSFTLKNDNLKDEELTKVTEKSLSLYQEGDLIIEEAETITLKENGENIPAGNYQLLIKFVYKNIEYSEQISLVIK